MADFKINGSIFDGKRFYKAGDEDAYLERVQGKVPKPLRQAGVVAGSVPPRKYGKQAASEDLSEKTKAELVEIAKDRDVEGYSTMNKDELLKALE